MDRYVFDNFRGPFLNFEEDSTDAVVTDAGINTVVTSTGNLFQYRLEQAFAGTPPQIQPGTYGALIVLDAADNDGLTLDLGYGAAGAVDARSRGVFTVGTDEAFFVRVKLMVADVSDADQIFVGFVVGGHPVDGLLDTYTDYAGLNIDNGDIKVETRLNSGTAGAVDTTQNVIDHASSTDNAVTLEVRVSAGGVCTFLVNGAAPTTDVTGFEFDDDAVNAVVTVLNDAAGDPGVEILEWESGLLRARGLTGVADLVEAAQSDNP
jgi:hypothetical protein